MRPENIMNRYFRIFNDIPIGQADVDIIKSLMNSHREDQVLDYHGYLDLKKTLRTALAKDLKKLADKLKLRLAGIYAFTAHAGSETSIHRDGDEIKGALPWRLAYYVEGEAGTLSWYSEDEKSKYSEHVKAYVYNQELRAVYEQDLTNVRSAFVRTDIAHKLDISKTVTDRLTITATFLPWISWEELNHRLDELNED